nr:hypothetical protein [Angustibacter aerolatus]
MSQHQSAGSTADEHTAFEGREALLAGCSTCAPSSGRCSSSSASW